MIKSKKRNWIYFVLFFNTVVVQGQYLDSMHILLPLSEGLVSNVFINRYNFLIRNQAWADVNLESWKSNFNNGFGTDGDRFDTNFFGHPFHGSAYFNASRSLGNSFWESIPFTVMGSLTWEYFGENEIPSEIDFYTTTLGGIFLGECTHRISKYLLQPHRGAKNKIIRNTYISLLNPLGLLNHAFSPNAQREMLDPDDIYRIIGELTLGGSIPINNYNDKEFPNFIHFQYYLMYGNLFHHQGDYKPYDHFTFMAWAHLPVQKIEEDFFFNVTGIAPLFRRKTFNSSIFTVSQHYDFINNQAFKIGAMGVTADLSWMFIRNNHFLALSVNTGFLPFGGVESEVAEDLTQDKFFSRDYMYGRGYLTKSRLHYQFDNWVRMTMSLNRWVIYPIHDAKGKEVSRLLQIDLMFPIIDKLQIGAQLFKYNRKANYPELPKYNDVRQSYMEIRIATAYTFS